MNVWRSLAIGSVLSAVALTANAAATFTIRNNDDPGEGLNSATAFTPVGGNTATTLGQARLNVIQEAARIWGQLLQSNVPILVDVQFNALTCSATSGTLGSAGPRAVFRNVTGASSPNTFYVSALADAISGSNLSSNPSSPDIGATFNSAIDEDAACLGGRGFYYGLDHNRGTKVDLLLVVLHELSHGLGFTSQVNLSTGAGYMGTDNVERFESFTHRLFDEQLNALWPALTAQQRVDSAARTGQLAWSGPNVNGQGSRFSSGVTANSRIRMYAPSTVSSGSSVSHFDTALTPSVLMEPNLPGSITTSSVDITVCALQDIGWTVIACPHDGSNRAPVANSQSVATNEDTPITITLTASDPDGNALVWTVGTPPTLGTVSSISANSPRTIIYTPTANANGPDSFTFTVNDGSLSATGTVTVTVTPVNDAPTVQNVSSAVQSGQNVDIALLGSDIEGNALTYSIVSGPARGTATITGSTVSYRSEAGFSGADSLVYRANDGTLDSPTATVSITVTPTTLPATSGGGGGGGAMTSAWIFALVILSLLRTRRRIPLHA